MDQMQKPSRKLLFVGLGAASGLVLIIALVAFVLFGSTKRVENTQATETVGTKQVATKAEVQQNLSDLESTIKQATSDQAAAKAALKDSSNQVKVSS